MYNYFSLSQAQHGHALQKSFFSTGGRRRLKNKTFFFHFTCKHRLSFPLRTKSFFHWLLHVVVSYWWRGADSGE